MTDSAGAGRERSHGELSGEGGPALVRWLLAPLSDVSGPVRAALLGDVDLSLPLMLGAMLSFMLLDGVFCWLTRAPVFFGFLGANILLAVLRFAAVMLVRRDRAQRPWRTAFYVLATLGWCLCQGLLLGLSVLQAAPALQVLGAACALAPQGPFAARNFSAPRFAMATLLALDLPVALAGAFAPDRWLIVLTLATPGYMYALGATIMGLQKRLIENYVAQFASSEQARRDPLTGILNRLGMAEALEEGTRLQQPVALFYLDLDGFKRVNDMFGHSAGDTLLRLVSARLAEVARRGDSLARLGGDEFALIAPGLPAAAGEAMAARIVAAVGEVPYALGEGIAAQVGVSVGYACAPEDGASLAELSERADAALYWVKEQGKGRWRRAEGF